MVFTLFALDDFFYYSSCAYLISFFRRHEMYMRNLNQVSIEGDLLETSQKEMAFCNVLKTSQIHLKKDVSTVTSLRRLRNILKRCLLCDVFKTFRTHLKKDVYSVTSLGHLKISLASICDISKIPHKNGFV